MKQKMILSVLSLLSLGLIAGCGNTPSASAGDNPKPDVSTKNDGFSFQPIRPATDDTPTAETPTIPSSIDVDVLATIEDNGTYVVEGEDCDTSACTLQPGCSGFIEDVPEQYPTSGGSCIACIVAPSILAFKFEAKQDCTIEFHTVSAKYEANYDLDTNVSYYLDDEKDTPFVTGFASFGTDGENKYYNWKDVTIGTKRIAKGVHQFNISVKGNFANTDCFKLVVTEFGTEAAA